eukprot:Gb_22527 [translate_table: standard]
MYPCFKGMHILIPCWQKHYEKVLVDQGGRSQSLDAWVDIRVLEHLELTKINQPVTWKEVKSVVKEIEYQKATSVDGLPPEWFKAMLGSQTSERNIKWQKSTRVAFIDFKKDYDMVLHEASMKKLRATGVLGKGLDFIKNLCSNSLVKVMFENLVSPSIPVQRGVRQGFLASPSLFNTFINDITDGLKGLEVELKEMLKKVHEWVEKWGMACGIDKCKSMVVFGDQYSLKLEELLIGEDKIGVFDSYKYLGLEFDFKFLVERMIKEREVVGRKALFGRRSQGFFKYRGLKTWIVDLVNLPSDYRDGEKWSWVHCTKKWVLKHAPHCQNQGLLVHEPTWFVWESKHSIEALNSYKEFMLVESRDFCKKAMRYEDVAPKKIRSRIEGLESFVSKLWLTSVAIDDRFRLALLLGGEIGKRLHN